MEARQFAFVVDAGVAANGRGTGMPAFSGRFSVEEIENVAVYVAAASSESP